VLAVCIKSVQFSFRFSIELISQVNYRIISYVVYHTSLSYIQVSVSGYTENKGGGLTIGSSHTLYITRVCLIYR